MSATNDMAPHSAIVHIIWEVHEKKQDGSYHGTAKDKGKAVLVLDGKDLALTSEYANALIDLIKEGGKNVSELKINEERLEQSYLQGSSGPRNDNVGMFGMRGKIGKHTPS